MTAFDRAWSLLKQGVLRNKHTGEQVQLVGYDMIPDGMKTHQVAIVQRENGEKDRIEQQFLDAHWDWVGEE